MLRTVFLWTFWLDNLCMLSSPKHLSQFLFANRVHCLDWVAKIDYLNRRCYWDRKLSIVLYSWLTLLIRCRSSYHRPLGSQRKYLCLKFLSILIWINSPSFSLFSVQTGSTVAESKLHSALSVPCSCCVTPTLPACLLKFSILQNWVIVMFSIKTANWSFSEENTSHTALLPLLTSWSSLSQFLYFWCLLHFLSKKGKNTSESISILSR